MGGGPLALAGVWDRWQGRRVTLETVAILTVAAIDLMKPFHARMADAFGELPTRIER